MSQNKELCQAMKNSSSFFASNPEIKHKTDAHTLQEIDNAIYESYFSIISNHSVYNGKVYNPTKSENIKLTNKTSVGSIVLDTEVSSSAATTGKEVGVQEGARNDAGVKTDADSAFKEDQAGAKWNDHFKTTHNLQLNNIPHDDVSSDNERSLDEETGSHDFIDNSSLIEAARIMPTDNVTAVDMNIDITDVTKLPEGRCVCKECGEKFKSSYHLLRHKRKHDGNERPFVCQVCEKTFTEMGQLRKHFRTHTGEKPFKCNVCNKQFTQSHNLKRHLLIHTGEQPIQCLVCLQQFTCASNAKRHVMLKHKEHVDLSGEGESVLESLIKRSLPKSNNLKDNSLACKIETPGEEPAHQWFMGKPRKRGLGRRGYFCVICDREFSRSSHLRDHMFTHTGERPFICHLCGYGTTVKSALNKHLMIHSGEKPYICPICQKGFTNKSDMNTHQLVNHKEKAYQCGICSAQFAKGYMLARHMRDCHCEERAYQCDVCNKTFKTASYLSVHRRRHNVTAEEENNIYIDTISKTIETQIKTHENVGSIPSYHTTL